jgi:chloramphenicol 3-O-phosphotransferase
MEGYLRAAAKALKRPRTKPERARGWRRPSERRVSGKSSYDDGVRIALAAVKQYDDEIRKIK